MPVALRLLCNRVSNLKEFVPVAPGAAHRTWQHWCQTQWLQANYLTLSVLKLNKMFLLVSKLVGVGRRRQRHPLRPPMMRWAHSWLWNQSSYSRVSDMILEDFFLEDFETNKFLVFFFLKLPNLIKLIS